MNEIELDEAQCEVHKNCGGLVFLLESGRNWCMNCNKTWECDDGGTSDEGQEWENNQSE
jgi:hypothetical protein